MENITIITNKFETFRVNNLGKCLNYKEFQQIAKMFPCISGNYSLVVNFGLFTSPKKGEYFVSNTYVPQETIEALIAEGRNVTRKRNAKYLHKKKNSIHIKQTLEDLITSEHITEAQIIEYLLKTGNYKIQKKVINWENL